MIIQTLNGTFTMDQEAIALRGTHNLYNTMAAGIAAKILDIRDEKIRASLSGFPGVAQALKAMVRGMDSTLRKKLPMATPRGSPRKVLWATI